MHRLAGKKIAGLATQQRSLDERLNRSDRAQHGNGYGFRNERFNGDPLVLTPQWFTALDEKDGILRFDFVSSERCIPRHRLYQIEGSTPCWRVPGSPLLSKAETPACQGALRGAGGQGRGPSQVKAGILSPRTVAMGERRRGRGRGPLIKQRGGRGSETNRDGEDPIEYAADPTRKES